MKLYSFLIATISLGLTACGGGGGGGGGGVSAPPVSPPPPAIQTGQFKDSNTSGLAFSTASQSGTTDSQGAFSYRSGETVQFSVGGVTIGSAPGAAIITPIDLVPGGTSSGTEVRNIVRFLMMLDQNDDPADGIVISQAVRDIAVNWTQVDFATNDLQNELATIVSDVASVDSRAAALTDAITAQSHLEENFLCLVSGFFYGSLTGDRVQPVYFLFNPSNGLVKVNFGGAPADFVSVDPTSVDQQRTFMAEGPNADGSNFSGRFDSFDDISGVWSNGQQSGTFSATRELPTSVARYRFTGQWFHDFVKPAIEGPMVLNIASDGTINGVGYSISNGSRFGNTGMLTGQDINLDWDPGARSSGQFDQNLFVQGTGVNQNGQQRPWFAQGCVLN